MKNIFTTLLALLALSPMAANADALYLGGWSVHMGGSTDNDGYKLNSKHDLIGVEYENFFVATMINSYHTRGYVAGYQFDLIDAQYADVNVMLGATSGYTEEQNSMFRFGSLNGFGAISLEFNTPYVKPTVMLFGTAFVLTTKYEF